VTVAVSVIVVVASGVSEGVSVASREGSDVGVRVIGKGVVREAVLMLASAGGLL